MQNSKLVQTIDPLLASDQPQYQAALSAIVQAFGAVTGTLHRSDGQQPILLLVASLGLPEALLPVVGRIPFGKGIAGLCAERREPITLCNLQTDESGQARENAKQTGVAGAIAVPVYASNGELAGVLGIGKPGAHDYTADEQRLLADCSQLFGRALSR